MLKPVMKPDQLIIPLKSNLLRSETGNKAWSLGFLQQHNFKIPETYIIGSSVYEYYKKNESELTENLKKALDKMPEFTYAVRSSTNLEDSDNFSHAGQFQTFTNVKGADNLYSSIKEVWLSAVNQTNSEYQQKIGNEDENLKCAVILQKMIPAKMAGVSFSKNPVNGQNETLVEAVEGPGEELVQKGSTPLRWKFRFGKLVEGTKENPYYHIIEKVKKSTQKLKNKFGKDIDIEWVYDGFELYYLQLRSITTQQKIMVYSNKMAQEMLPGQIKPLVWSVNISLVNGVWINLLSEICGKLNVKPEELAKSFYFRTYFNMTALETIFHSFGLSAKSLENMYSDTGKMSHSFRPGPGMFRHTFRAIRFIKNILTYEKTFLKDFEPLKERYKQLSLKIDSDYSKENFQVLFDELFKEGRKLTRMNIIIQLLMRMKNKKFIKKLEKKKLNINSFDFNSDFPELEKLSPLPSIYKLKKKLDLLPVEIRSNCTTYESLTSISEAKPILIEFENFVNEFGHFSESGNDFSFPKWEEDKEMVFKMVINTPLPEENEHKFNPHETKRSLFKSGSIKKNYIKAGNFKVYREQISSLYIFGFGLFRKLFLKLSDEFIGKGFLMNKDDIFYLSKTEIDELLNDNNTIDSKTINEMVNKLKLEMDGCSDIILPSVIFGENAPIIETGSLKNFKGVAASPGIYRGSLKILKGMSDFSKVERGDILAIPFSDVSWTPVLSKAGAIVSESGGILSHCSIIARELGIPAIVSVENVCSLTDNLQVTIDGSNGILTIHNYE